MVMKMYELGKIGMLLTKSGLNVLSAGLAGELIEFTRVAIGDGILEVADETEYRQTVLEMDDIKNWRMDLPIIECVNKGDGTAYLHVLKDNAEVSEGFFAREIAVYATDQVSGEEVLYSYRNSGDLSSFIPSNTGPVTKVIELAVTTIIQNAPNVSAVLDNSFAYVSLQKYNAHVEAEHPHPNIPNHYDDVSTADYFWVTDNDNDLHKISISDTQKLLLSELRENVSTDSQRLYELETMTNARVELGLEPLNMLIVEDFKPTTEIEYFSKGVVSCAKGGKIIGLEDTAGLITGNTYIISDNLNAEEVTLVGISYKNNYYRAELAEPLKFEYLENVKLYRTTFLNTETVDSKTIQWSSKQIFSGIEANNERKLTLDFAEIEGDGYFENGYFILGRN